MSIFRRDNPAPANPAASAGPVPASAARDGRLTRIAPGTRIEGKVAGTTELLVEGEVEGAIAIEASVMVGPGGVVRGPISAQVLRVAGQVFGDVRGGERVEVAAAGTLEGDIAAPRVIIAEGAFFKGKVEMQGDKARGERASSRAAGEGEKGK